MLVDTFHISTAQENKVPLSQKVAVYQATFYKEKILYILTPCSFSCRGGILSDEINEISWKWSGHAGLCVSSQAHSVLFPFSYDKTKSSYTSLYVSKTL